MAASKRLLNLSKTAVALLLVTIWGSSCAKLNIQGPFASYVTTRVSSVSIKPIGTGSVHVLREENSVESIKMAKLIEDSLVKKGFQLSDLSGADKVVLYAAVMRDLKIAETPIYSMVTNRHTGESTQQVTGYTTVRLHITEARIEFHDATLYRGQEVNSALWKGVGKTEAETIDMNQVMPYLIESLLDEMDNVVNSKLIRKQVRDS